VERGGAKISLTTRRMEKERKRVVGKISTCRQKEGGGERGREEQLDLRLKKGGTGLPAEGKKKTFRGLALLKAYH